MSQVPGKVVKNIVGKAAHLVLVDGAELDGHLVSFDGRSLWMVVGGEDSFIPLGSLVGIVANPVQPALA
jgi:hypothetical protein